jgi:hypothetical protein
MIFYRTKITKSRIHEFGLFAEENIDRGAVVGIMALGSDITSERLYQNGLRNDDFVYAQTGVRWIHKFFMYDERIMVEDYINHSHQANILYHCGILFAKRDIARGDEMTCDYRLFLAQNDVEAFYDGETGEWVDGYDSKTSLLSSSRQLIVLIEDAGFPQTDREVERVVKRFKSLPNVIDPHALPPLPEENVPPASENKNHRDRDRRNENTLAAKALSKRRKAKRTTHGQNSDGAVTATCKNASADPLR